MNIRIHHLLGYGALFAGFALHPLALAAAEQQEKALQQVKDQWALLDQYCIGCHNSEDWAGSVAFDTMTADNVHENTAVFEAAMRKLRGRLMPPPGNERPDEKTLDGFVVTME